MTLVTEGVRALLTDGQVVAIRQLCPADADAVSRLHEGLSLRDRHLRFFGPMPKNIAAFAVKLTRTGDVRHGAVGAFLSGALIGMANYEVLADATVAEIALAVDGTAQAHGVGTLLLEHLASMARARGVRRFVAEVLAENHRMMRLFREQGLPIRVTRDGPEIHIELILQDCDDYQLAVTERERVAEVASLRSVLLPGSVVVVGAGRHEGSIGHAVLRNVLAGAFTGTVWAVNPHANRVLGIPSYPSVAELPGAPELAVVCVPAAAVPDVVEQCGQRGVRAVVIISAGLTGTELADRVRASARRYGLRLIGPNCVGVANSDPGIRLNATFTNGQAPEGEVGVVTQSGGVGIALVERLRRLGLGISTLVSTGDKYDVSGNDLLLWWLRDDRTRMAVLYLESFGNPRKFGRLARILARDKPVLAVRSGSTDIAQRAAASHTAATATPAVVRDALFDQAGIIAVDTLADLIGVIAALSGQPLPTGNRIAILSNAGGLGVLAADACARHGLTLPALSEATTATLRRLLPDQASIGNPIDTTAGVDARTFGRCLDAILADDHVDAVIAAPVPTALGDPMSAVHAKTAKPIFAVRAGQSASVALHRTIPTYDDPDAAAFALGHLAKYSTWLQHSASPVPELSDMDPERALALLRRRFGVNPEGGWLAPLEVTALLRCFGIPVADTRFAADEDAAVTALAELTTPVAVKAVAEGLLHKSEQGGVLLNIADADGVRQAFRKLRHRFGTALRGIILQPMAEPGRELLAGISADETFGPLIVFGLGGVDTDLVADRSARLAPLTEADAHDLLHGLRASPTLFSPVSQLDPDSLTRLLLRVSRLAELLPEVAELDLNPIIATPHGCLVVDARVRIRPHEPIDPYLRRLR